MFGAVGVIVASNDLPTWLAYVGSLVVALVVMVLVQLLVKNLRASEDGVPVSLVGVQGTATTAIDPARGEVSLDAAHELEAPPRVVRRTHPGGRASSCSSSPGAACASSGTTPTTEVRRTDHGARASSRGCRAPARTTGRPAGHAPTGPSYDCRTS